MENLFDSDWFGKVLRKHTNHLFSKLDPDYDKLSHEEQNEHIKRNMTPARVDAVVDSLKHHSDCIINRWANREEQLKSNLDMMLLKDTHDLCFLAAIIGLSGITNAKREFLAGVIKHCVDTL